MKNHQPFDRIDKVNSLLQKEIDILLQKEKIGQKSFKNDILLSITKVETSRDLKNAKVFFSVMPTNYRGDAIKYLSNRAYPWQKKLGEKITLKYIPKLNFIFDKGQQNALEVEEILQSLKK